MVQVLQLAFRGCLVAVVGSRRNASGTRRSPIQERSRVTVDAIVEAAAQVFVESGYDATTNDIAARAGVSIGTLYQYFADKDALLVRLAELHVESARHALTDTLVRTVAEGGPDIDRAALVRATIETTVERNQPRGLAELLYTTAPRTPELVATLETLRNDLAATVGALLEADGIAPTEAHSRGHAIIVAIDALIHEHVTAAPDAEEQERRVDEVVTLTLAALEAFGR